jgi:hypothetical protein
MFRTDLLSFIRSLNTVFTATGICHTSYVDCLLADSYVDCLRSLNSAVFTAIGICHTSYVDCLLADSQRN